LVSITGICNLGDLVGAYEQCVTESTGMETDGSAHAAAVEAPSDPRARQRELRKNALRGA